MQGRGVRGGPAGRRRRAVVVVCALGVLAGPAAGSAYADPEPRPSPGPSSGGGTAGTPQDPGAADGAGTAAGAGAAGTDSLEDVRARVARLHDKAESATEAYNAAEERVEKQQKAIVGLARKIDRTQDKLDRMTSTAGAMARAQYRNGGLPDEAQVLLGEDPAEFLRDVSLARKGQQAAKGFLDELTGTRAKLDAYAKDAGAEWRKLEADRKRKAAAKKKIKAQLDKAEKLESRLAKEEREKLRELEDKAAYERQARWLKSGVLDEIDSKASKAGKRAIEYATSQIGKDYEWGAEGPDTFDCSGLTSKAWAAAGEQIPRTSQEQWKQLPKVPVEKMRPGDLIIYKQDASHVAMYVGDGAMVHAPRTGRQITIEGAGSLPILGVVRPDK